MSLAKIWVEAALKLRNISIMESTIIDTVNVILIKCVEPVDLDFLDQVTLEQIYVWISLRINLEML